MLEVLGKIPDNTVHLAITSPPYNVGKDYDSHNDKMDYGEYLNWLNKIWIETKRILVPGGRFCLNIAPTGIKDFVPIHQDFTNQLRKIGMTFRTEIIWYKQTMLKRTAWGSFKSPSFSPAIKEAIFKKDGYKCVLCGRGLKEGFELHVDHTKPKDFGGEATLENGQTLCSQHNFLKKNFKQTETGKRFFIRLYELAKKENNQPLLQFCVEILEVFEKNNINGHIVWKR